MTKESKNTYIKDIKKRLSNEMPRILKEISVYEDKLLKGELNSNPKISPQFNE